ncbi:hypothetical protein FOZ60_011890 [Perkinsus olseni]|uniref:Uncharacterized protein n=1 Tax=Perkinsus olseni TaxID=32597 RepID=A0A7J6PBH7_PEROL|nr:hypothetical protein FOZ60_011890 [Perkinsus olseni]
MWIMANLVVAEAELFTIGVEEVEERFLKLALAAYGELSPGRLEDIRTTWLYDQALKRMRDVAERMGELAAGSQRSDASTTTFIICHCREPLTWLANPHRIPYIPPESRLLVYEKCGTLSNIPANISQRFSRGVSVLDRRDGDVRGDECSAYLSYIVEEYHQLDDYTVFLQADPHNHAFLAYLQLPLMAIGLGTYQVPFLHLNYHRHVMTDTPCMRDVEMYIVSRERIQARSLSFYRHMLRMVDGSIPDLCVAEAKPERSSHCYVFEFLWHVVFGEPRQLPLRPDDKRLPTALRAKFGQLNQHQVPPGLVVGASSASASSTVKEQRSPDATLNYHDDDVMKKLWRDAKLNPRSEDSWSKLLEALILRNEKMNKLPLEILPTLGQPLALERLLVALARVLVPQEGAELLRRMPHIIGQQQWSGDFEIGMVCRGLSRLFQNQADYLKGSSSLSSVHQYICRALFTDDVRMILRKPNVALEAVNFLLVQLTSLDDSDVKEWVVPLLNIVHKACKESGYSAKMQTSLLPVVAVRSSIRCGSLAVVQDVSEMALEAVDAFGKKRRIIGSTSKVAERVAAIEAILRVIHLNPSEINCNLAIKLQETALTDMNLATWATAVHNTLESGALDRGQSLLKYVTLSTIHPRFPTQLPQDSADAEECLLLLLDCAKKARFSPLPFLRWALKNSAASRTAKEEILRMLPDWASERASLMNELHPGANTLGGNSGVDDDYVTIRGCPAGLEGIYKRMGTHNGKHYYIRTEPRKDGPMSLYFTGKVWQLGRKYAYSGRAICIPLHV